MTTTHRALLPCTTQATAHAGGWRRFLNGAVVARRRMYTSWCNDYPIISIEDPFDQVSYHRQL